MPDELVLGDTATQDHCGVTFQYHPHGHFWFSTKKEGHIPVQVFLGGRNPIVYLPIAQKSFIVVNPSTRTHAFETAVALIRKPPE